MSEGALSNFSEWCNSNTNSVNFDKFPTLFEEKDVAHLESIEDTENSMDMWKEGTEEFNKRNEKYYQLAKKRASEERFSKHQKYYFRGAMVFLVSRELVFCFKFHYYLSHLGGDYRESSKDWFHTPFYAIDGLLEYYQSLDENDLFRDDRLIQQELVQLQNDRSGMDPKDLYEKCAQLVEKFEQETDFLKEVWQIFNTPLKIADAFLKNIALNQYLVEHNEPIPWANRSIQANNVRTNIRKHMEVILNLSSKEFNPFGGISLIRQSGVRASLCPPPNSSEQKNSQSSSEPHTEELRAAIFTDIVNAQNHSNNETHRQAALDGSEEEDGDGGITPAGDVSFLIDENNNDEYVFHADCNEPNETPRQAALDGNKDATHEKEDGNGGATAAGSLVQLQPSRNTSPLDTVPTSRKPSQSKKNKANKKKNSDFIFEEVRRDNTKKLRKRDTKCLIELDDDDEFKRTFFSKRLKSLEPKENFPSTMYIQHDTEIGDLMYAPGVDQGFKTRAFPESGVLKYALHHDVSINEWNLLLDYEKNQNSHVIEIVKLWDDYMIVRLRKLTKSTPENPVDPQQPFEALTKEDNGFAVSYSFFDNFIHFRLAVYDESMESFQYHKHQTQLYGFKEVLAQHQNSRIGRKRYIDLDLTESASTLFERSKETFYEKIGQFKKIINDKKDPKITNKDVTEEELFLRLYAKLALQCLRDFPIQPRHILIKTFGLKFVIANLKDYFTVFLNSMVARFDQERKIPNRVVDKDTGKLKNPPRPKVLHEEKLKSAESFGKRVDDVLNTRKLQLMVNLEPMVYDLYKSALAKAKMKFACEKDSDDDTVVAIGGDEDIDDGNDDAGNDEGNDEGNGGEYLPVAPRYDDRPDYLMIDFISLQRKILQSTIDLVTK